ncbi:hypothetical protein BZG36_04395 [Bifiguratus adelaidae]|uniref:Uncharacterized protein n=1 Tax=Bifiguratus adelaidae TaxID=1938954 RepID=A0A261XVN9_9FUNG|nr:hypothetical protein BZG36_04395 [Bifiguratus adelaidae]
MLTIQNFQSSGGKLYCAKHVPKAKATTVADPLDIRNAKAAPKADPTGLWKQTTATAPLRGGVSIPSSKSTAPRKETTSTPGKTSSAATSVTEKLSQTESSTDATALDEEKPINDEDNVTTSIDSSTAATSHEDAIGDHPEPSADVPVVEIPSDQPTEDTDAQDVRDQQSYAADKLDEDKKDSEITQDRSEAEEALGKQVEREDEQDTSARVNNDNGEDDEESSSTGSPVEETTEPAPSPANAETTQSEGTHINLGNQINDDEAIEALDIELEEEKSKQAHEEADPVDVGNVTQDLEITDLEGKPKHKESISSNRAHSPTDARSTTEVTIVHGEPDFVRKPREAAE